ncbi:MAG: ribonuclease E/G [Planctomycetota bacterium]
MDLRLHEGSRPLFEALDLERGYQRLFAARVPIGQGASIVIHETEALTAIDVNSGRVERDTLEETALETNLRAAAEVLRQVRLRDLGGIVVVDFIDMREAANRREVELAMRDGLRRDRARMKCGRLGSFGLLTFTRRRLGTGPARASEAMCRGCGGSGNVAHHRAGALRVLRRLRALEGPSRLKLRAQPGLVHELRHHREALEALGHRLDTVEDYQVPAGDPVLELLGGLASTPPQG